ncbi:hypothetical protein [Micromonospora zhanjiangensis]
MASKGTAALEAMIEEATVDATATISHARRSGSGDFLHQAQFPLFANLADHPWEQR